jgi:hypothetical protein
MHQSLSTVLGRARAGALAIGLMATLAAPALPVHALAASVSVTPGSLTVPLSGTGTLTVQVTTDTPSLGFQMGATFDPTRIQIDSVVRGTNGSDSYLDTYVATPAGGSVIPASAFSFNNTAGTIGAGGAGAFAIVGASGPGFVGTGPAITIHFHALTVNGSSSLNLTNVSINGVPAANTTINNGTIITGSVPLPNLVVQNAATAQVSGDANSFNVTFNVANTGTANAGASTASVAVTGAAPASMTVPVAAINAGSVSAMLTAGPFTLATGSTLGNVTITADSANVVTESSESDNTATTAYQHAALNSNGQTPINASLAGFLLLTAPPAVTNFVLTAGRTNTVDPSTNPGNVLNVRANVPWSVTISGDNNGHLAEWNGSAYVAGGPQLNQALDVRNDSVTTVHLSGTAQMFVSGTAASSDPVAGNTYPIGFDQFVGYNDTPVAAPNSYNIVVAWTGSGTF